MLRNQLRPLGQSKVGIRPYGLHNGNGRVDVCNRHHLWKSQDPFYRSLLQCLSKVWPYLPGMMWKAHWTSRSNMSQNKQQYIVNKERSSYLILWYQGKVRSGFYGIRETLHPVVLRYGTICFLLYKRDLVTLSRCSMIWFLWYRRDPVTLSCGIKVQLGLVSMV